jgi:ERF superfamily
MMVMAFQSSPIFSLPRARLECSVFRFMRPLGVLPASYYHGEVRREATEAARGREFRSHSRKSSSNAQTTAIDSAVGMVNLTTTLAHASGEWIASDRPVCPVAETANPHRMRAALTYARRYAPFALVGIAGEDDLDAPDICAPAPATGPLGGARTAGSAEAAGTDRPATGRGTDGPAGGLQLPARSHGNGARRGAKPSSPPVLSSAQSAALRDRLLVEIAALPSEDSATTGRSGRWWPKISSPPPTRGCWRLSNWDCPRSCRPNAPGRPSAVGLGVHLRLPAMTRSERALVRMMSVFQLPAVIATRRTFAMSPTSPASSVAASHPTRITYATCSRGPWVARRATSSRCRSVESIIDWYTA